MGKKTAILGVAALAGLGYYIGKKLLADKMDVKAAVVKQNYNEKVRKASMYCIGAIKTSGEKIAEGISEIANGNMVKKGEDTFEQAKKSTSDFKQEIENLKEMVVSINDSPVEDDFYSDIIDFEFNEVEENPENNSETL